MAPDALQELISTHSELALEHFVQGGGSHPEFPADLPVVRFPALLLQFLDHVREPRIDVLHSFHFSVFSVPCKSGHRKGNYQVFQGVFPGVKSKLIRLFRRTSGLSAQNAVFPDGSGVQL